MTFHTFNPSTDTLEVGTKIRLAGREGEITDTEYEDDRRLQEVCWSNGDRSLDALREYQAIEIEDIPAKPLTIDKRVKGEIEKRLIQTNGWGLQDKGMFLEGKIKDIFDYIGSLEET